MRGRRRKQGSFLSIASFSFPIFFFLVAGRRRLESTVESRPSCEKKRRLFFSLSAGAIFSMLFCLLPRREKEISDVAIPLSTAPSLHLESLSRTAASVFRGLARCRRED